MKPITKQLVVAAFILTLVTVLSLGIRHVRFSAYRANTIKSPVIAEAEPDHYPADSYTVEAEPDTQHANTSDSDVEAEPEPQYANTSDWEVNDEPDSQRANAWDSDKEAPFDYHYKVESFKGDYAKFEGSKGLERISLGDYENLYLTREGQLWYVSEPPDGKAVKMQVVIDDTTGEIILVDAMSGGSKDLERISLGDYENLYITGEAKLWYVSEPPDGETVKMPALIDETTGEIIIVDVK
ncbi:MAG: hypothetical protein ACYS80_16960 [Planctomycetota bacterium]|jgi:hypothetical protein